MTKSFVNPRSPQYFNENKKVCAGFFWQIPEIQFPLIIPSSITCSIGLQANIGRAYRGLCCKRRDLLCIFVGHFLITLVIYFLFFYCLLSFLSAHAFLNSFFLLHFPCTVFS